MDPNLNNNTFNGQRDDDMYVCFKIYDDVRVCLSAYNISILVIFPEQAYKGIIAVPSM